MVFEPARTNGLDTRQHCGRVFCGVWQRTIVKCGCEERTIVGCGVGRELGVLGRMQLARRKRNKFGSDGWMICLVYRVQQGRVQCRRRAVLSCGGDSGQIAREGRGRFGHVDPSGHLSSKISTSSPPAVDSRRAGGQTGVEVSNRGPPIKADPAEGQGWRSRVLACPTYFIRMRSRLSVSITKH